MRRVKVPKDLPTLRDMQVWVPRESERPDRPKQSNAPVVLELDFSSTSPDAPPTPDVPPPQRPAARTHVTKSDVRTFFGIS